MSYRLEQVNSLIQQKLGEVFTREIEFPIEFFVTISKVDIDKDLRAGKIYISVIPFNQSKNALGLLIRRKKEIQRALGKLTKLQFTPALTFRIDDTEEEAAKIEQLINEANS